jgi:hypothetical protein
MAIDVVLPFVSYRYVALAASSLTVVFTNCLARFPESGYGIMTAIYQACPKSMRASWLVRFAVAVFSAMESVLAASYAIHFYRFLADGLRSPNRLIVNAAMSILEKPDGIQVVVRDAEIACRLIVPPLEEILDRHWFVKMRERAAAALEMLAQACGQALSRCRGERKEHQKMGEVSRSFEKWKAVIEKAQQGDTIFGKELLEKAKKLCTRSPMNEFHRVSKPYPPKRPEAATLVPSPASQVRRRPNDRFHMVMTPIVSLKRHPTSGNLQ